MTSEVNCPKLIYFSTYSATDNFSCQSSENSFSFCCLIKFGKYYVLKASRKTSQVTRGIKAPLFRHHHLSAGPFNIKVTSCTLCSGVTSITSNNLVSLIQSLATSGSESPLKASGLSFQYFLILLVSTPPCPVLCCGVSVVSDQDSLSLIIIAKLFTTLHNQLKSSECPVTCPTCGAGGVN